MPETIPDRDAASAPRAATIAGAILIPQDRIARQPLTPLAAELTHRLQGIRRTVRGTHELSAQISRIGNVAGLIAASRGEMAVAWRLTERHLWWHGRQARRSGDATVTAHALQPWVNLGRLESLAGRCDEALSRLQGLSSFPISDRLELGCVRLSGPAWKALVPSRERFLEFLESIFVSDSLKAMLLNRRFDLVQPFAGRLPGEGELHWIGEEACVAREARGWYRAVFRLRAAEAYTCAGEGTCAAGILTQMAGVVQQMSGKRKADPKLLPVTARLATACQEAGLAEFACLLARDVLNAARAARDEPIQIEMLRVLATTAPAAERQSWAQAAWTLAGDTEYARYRRGGAPPASAVVAELYRCLDEVFAN